MKNVLLKFYMVVIFFVILFANFTCVHAENVFDEGINATLYRQDLEDKMEMEYRITISEGQAGKYLIYVDGDNKEFKINSNGVSRLNWSGNGAQTFELGDDIEYTITLNCNSSLTIIKATQENIETYGVDFDGLEASGAIDLVDIPQAGVAEKVFSMYFLDFGDYAHNFLTGIFGEDVTIDRIVFNKVNMLNANFFEKSSNPANNKATDIIRDFINRWFGYFKGLALVVIMVSIIAAGIRILIQTPQAKAKAYESIKKVVLAVVLIYFFPYVMRFAFEINEAIIGYICQSDTTEYVKAVNISPYTNLDEDDIEFRSPKYVSKEGSMLSSSSSDNTDVYLVKIGDYEKMLNVMGLIRAFAGVTYRFVYVVIWYIMLAQVYILAFIYIKRYLTIAFLIIIYPLVIAGYVIDGVVGKRKGAFNTWCKSFFASVFLQTIHAVMYGIISGILVNQILRRGTSSLGTQKINVILMIVATSFLFSGEKILKKFWKSSIDSSTERKGLRAAFGMPRKVINSFKGK